MYFLQVPLKAYIYYGRNEQSKANWPNYYFINF